MQNDPAVQRRTERGGTYTEVFYWFNRYLEKSDFKVRRAR
ncbi:hypothetical protein LEP1GSC187_1122 [Leptospira santarosai str. ZUN179]|uniref:Uncharacterized protein n=1 Tax=Leptospira santarosai str. ZUN179 TaxID=1049985 RepID=M6VC36_9LEPT|nr:hypothetical protein LEP1GSC187_1122 [Leptospira santarosai str. ZUN179]